MKLNFGRRLVLFVHWLMSLALCALGVALFVWPECRATVGALLGNMDVFIYAIAVLAVYLVFAAGSVAIICGGKKKRRDGDFIIVDSCQTGRTRIAVSAVEQMIRQAVRNISGISEMKASIVNGQDSIDINTDVVILNSVHVPTVTACIQRAIRGYIEQNCGVNVRSVSVSIHSVAEEEQARGRKNRKKKTEVGNAIEQTSVAKGPYMTPEEAMGPVPDVPVFEPEADFPVESAPEASAPEEAPIVEEPVDAPAAEEPVEEPAAVEEPVAAAEPAAEEPAPKRGLFKRLFGKREKEADAPAAEETPAEAEASADADAVAEEGDEAEPFAFDAQEPFEAEEASADEMEVSQDEPGADDDFAAEPDDEPEAEPDAGADEAEDKRDTEF